MIAEVRGRFLLVITVLAAIGVASPAVTAQAHDHGPGTDGSQPERGHEMFMRVLGGGWRLHGMAQLFPIVTTGFGSGTNEAVTGTEFYATQPAIMFNVESPGSRWVLRTTLNLEGLTLPEGELTFGGWGEGFIDKRHPHTVVHEAVLSLNLWDVAGGELSFSAGKGFAPFGTDDPMSRPAVKFPTNHHLSQVLERFLASGTYHREGWSLEAGVFGGTEPTGPYDFSNIESFPNSWSARLTRRFGGERTTAPWEVSASVARVVEVHDREEQASNLVNAYVRHERSYRFGTLYSLLEASRSDPDDFDGFWAVLGEAQVARGGHRPYVRFEAATRPEYEREGAPGAEGFFRYDHDDQPIGATRWYILTAGYGYDLTALPLSVRPFVEIQHNAAGDERGPVAARELFGTNRVWTLSAGLRLFFGGGPMRMGGYGVLDAMTDMMRVPDAEMEEMDHHEHHH